MAGGRGLEQALGVAARREDLAEMARGEGRQAMPASMPALASAARPVSSMMYSGFGEPRRRLGHVEPAAQLLQRRRRRSGRRRRRCRCRAHIGEGEHAPSARPGPGTACTMMITAGVISKNPSVLELVIAGPRAVAWGDRAKPSCLRRPRLGAASADDDRRRRALLFSVGLGIADRLLRRSSVPVQAPRGPFHMTSQ